MMRDNKNTQRQKKKITPTYAAIRIWPDTRILLRKIGHKTETYDQIIHMLIDSYMRKEEDMLHRVRQSQDWTPVTYGNIDATREDTSSLLSSSIDRKTTTSEDDIKRHTTIPPLR